MFFSGKEIRSIFSMGNISCYPLTQKQSNEWQQNHNKSKIISTGIGHQPLTSETSLPASFCRRSASLYLFSLYFAVRQSLMLAAMQKPHQWMTWLRCYRKWKSLIKPRFMGLKASCLPQLQSVNGSNPRPLCVPTLLFTWHHLSHAQNKTLLSFQDKPPPYSPPEDKKNQ